MVKKQELPGQNSRKSTDSRSIIISTLWYIYEGYHSFAEIAEALDLATKRHNNEPGDPYTSYHVFECLIPVGAKYWTGEFAGVKGYCSDQIIIQKEIFSS